jgi:hypothetical protein
MDAGIQRLAVQADKAEEQAERADKRAKVSIAPIVLFGAAAWFSTCLRTFTYSG